ncbi:hypothetical protein [Microvirga sp. G4-2]|uniref:hypothetical protein n=1 Tax=Microvirga sp. G4-2 TaxID=3434467 RepID=UPI004044D58F
MRDLRDNPSPGRLALFSTDVATANGIAFFTRLTEMSVADGVFTMAMDWSRRLRLPAAISGGDIINAAVEEAQGKGDAK